MDYLQDILQIIAGLGILNVWLLRFQSSTRYRGGRANNMKEEFAAYGLPEWSVYVIGFLKLSSAVGLILGVFFTPLTLPSALMLAALMVGALAMHIKVSDPIKKSVPAICMLAMTLIIVILTL